MYNITAFVYDKLTSDVVLGMKFFSHNDAIIRFGPKTLETDSDVTAPSSNEFPEHPLYITEPLTIPPQHECQVLVRNLRPSSGKAFLLLFF